MSSLDRKLSSNNLVFLMLIGLISIPTIVLPDIDLSLPLLHHRSMITHSVLIPFLLMCMKKYKLPDVVILSIFLAFAVHMSADLTPKAWKGYALIYFPIFNISFFGAMGSALWIFFNIIACFYFFSKIFREKYPTIKKNIIFILVFLVSLFYTVEGESIMTIVYSMIGIFVWNSDWVKNLFLNNDKKNE